MKHRRIFAALALCFLLATQYHIGNHIICVPEQTDDFQAFQFHTIAEFWDKLGEWSGWAYLE